MGRPRTGSVYGRPGRLYLAITVGKRRRSFPFQRGLAQAEADLRRSIIVELSERLEGAGHLQQAELLCEKAAACDAETFPRVVELAKGLLTGTMKPARPLSAGTPKIHGTMHGGMTVRDFSEKFWTSNELARRYRRQVKVIDHTENIRRMRTHVFPVVFDDRPIGDTPLDEFTLEHAEHVLSQASLPEGSVRHVAQCLHRVFKLAVYPAKILKQTPFPPGWLPIKNDLKERTFLYPKEEAPLMRLTSLPLVWRVFFGFCAREGLRRHNAVTVEWAALDLDLDTITLDVTKNGRGGFWKLDPGTAEALRRWRRLCPSDRYVFPAEALPRHRKRLGGTPLSVGKAAEKLREALVKAGQDRAQLFARSDHRIRLRAHDLRATFVTLALALGQTEDWVMQRTGHLSSATLGIYKRNAKTAKEINLGWLHPMHEVIPELAALGGPSQAGKGPRLVLVGGTDVDR
ncbi:MAG: site-specific integrase [Polyangiaceae bacterium]|nr:site-specific integrase [Polyangiaceae bacterium]